MSSDLPPTREDVYYYVQDDTVGLRYITRTLRPHLKVLETLNRADLYEPLRAENERLREEIDRLKNPPKRYCAKCGHPEDNHPYRHPFVALETKGKRDE